MSIADFSHFNPQPKPHLVWLDGRLVVLNANQAAKDIFYWTAETHGRFVAAQRYAARMTRMKVLEQICKGIRDVIVLCPVKNDTAYLVRLVPTGDIIRAMPDELAWIRYWIKKSVSDNLALKPPQKPLPAGKKGLT